MGFREMIPAADYVAALLRAEKLLFFRFAFMSVSRALLSMLTIVLIHQFLAGVLGGEGGLAGMLAARAGIGAALWIVAGLLMASYILTSLASFDSQVVEQRLIRSLELGVMERLTRHLLSLSANFFDSHSHGDLVHAMRQDVTRLRLVLSAYARIVLDASVSVALIVTAIWMSPRVVLVAMLAIPLLAWPVLWLARQTLRQSFQVRERGTQLYDIILQILRGIRVIKIYQGEAGEAQRSSERGHAYFEATIAAARMESLGRVFLESVAGLTVVVAVIAGGFEVLNGRLSWPSMLAFLMAIRSVHGPLNNINASYLEVQRYGASLARIRELLDQQPSIGDRPDAQALAAPPQRIAFESVGFAYDGHPVLEDISVEVRAGETLGIAGPSGAGKTTMLSLLARFYDPGSGRVAVDGKDLRDVQLSSWYENLALVPQEPFLFAATVRDNIRCGRPRATEAEVEAAARAAELHEDIVTWPLGYDTVLGIGGRGISEGQAQRLNIARALLKNAPVLILDEATSSLDSIAEAKVQRAIDLLVRGRTTFVVAHRLSTLRNADRILVLDRGRCVGMGRHEELLTACPLYAQMWEPQRISPDPVQTPDTVQTNDLLCHS
jgi:subfamily B ATP-binding cassette protein MsbA